MNFLMSEQKEVFSHSFRTQTTLHTTELLSRVKTDLKLPVYMLTGTDLFSASSFFSTKKVEKGEKYVHNQKCGSNVNLRKQLVVPRCIIYTLKMSPELNFPINYATLICTTVKLH